MVQEENEAAPTIRVHLALATPAFGLVWSRPGGRTANTR